MLVHFVNNIFLLLPNNFYSFGLRHYKNWNITMVKYSSFMQEEETKTWIMCYCKINPFRWSTTKATKKNGQFSLWNNIFILPTNEKSKENNEEMEKANKRSREIKANDSLKCMTVAYTRVYVNTTICKQNNKKNKKYNTDRNRNDTDEIHKARTKNTLRLKI